MIAHEKSVDEIVVVDLLRKDAIMRERAFENCNIKPRCNSFCANAGKCIAREIITLWWLDLVVRN